MKFPSTSSTIDDPAINGALIQQPQQFSTQLPDAKVQTILRECAKIS